MFYHLRNSAKNAKVLKLSSAIALLNDMRINSFQNFGKARVMVPKKHLLEDEPLFSVDFYIKRDKRITLRGNPIPDR